MQDNIIQHFDFTDKMKKATMAMIALGVLTFVFGLIGLSGERIWSNLYINGFFFFGISIIGTFFLAVQYAAESGWPTVVKRQMEAMSMYVPVGSIFLIIVFLGGTFHLNHIFHWMDPEVVNPDSPHFDRVIAGKSGYLNQPFFWIRTLLYLGVWYYFTMQFRKNSIAEDTIGGTDIHFKNVRNAAIFLVFFGFTSSTASWDWLMSIDTHWFSTLYGWYVFSGMWCSSMIFLIMLTLWLKSKGYMSYVNESHIHDLGKWVFATSFLWSYLFFSQFMLIWYSNIPEEVTYFLVRIQDYTFIYWGMFAINFIVPMLLLMDRDMKRNPKMIAFVGSIIFVGHWLDVYMLITPGTMQDRGELGLYEVGMFIGFLGLFLYVVLNALTKASLLPKNHPYVQESLHHEIH
jgi:hypothetical protein